MDRAWNPTRGFNWLSVHMFHSDFLKRVLFSEICRFWLLKPWIGWLMMFNHDQIDCLTTFFWRFIDMLTKSKTLPYNIIMFNTCPMIAHLKHSKADLNCFVAVASVFLFFLNTSCEEFKTDCTKTKDMIGMDWVLCIRTAYSLFYSTKNTSI